MAQLADVLLKVNKDFKKELAVKGIRHLQLKRIPFTSPRLNYETYGGIPRGRVSMFAGKESSGKTTTALDAVKNAQILFKKEFEDEVKSLTKSVKDAEKIVNDKSATKSAKEKAKKTLAEDKERLDFLKKRGELQIVYFDAEGTIDKDWAIKLGVDVDNVWYVPLHTQTAEQFLDTVIQVVRDSDNVGLVVIDSIAVLVPQIIHGESLEQKSFGGNAAVVTTFCNEVCPILGEKEIALICINQARDDLANPYADFRIPGGNGLKLACSLIMTFQKGKLLDAEGNEQKNSYENPQGNLVWTRIVKTKICRPDRRVGFYTLSYNYGVDVVADLIPMAIETQVVEKSGSWFKIIDKNNPEGYMTYDDGEIIKFQGQMNLMNFLRETPEAYQFVERTVMAKISGQEDILQVDAEKDAEAIADLKAEAEAISGGVKLREEIPIEEKVEGAYEAPDEIPMEV